MNLRERFHEVMNFNPAVHAIKWEFGYWGETVKNWYRQGLPMHNYPLPGKTITTPTSSLYTMVWNCAGSSELPNGIAVTAGGLYSPSQGFPLDTDVRRHFDMDDTQKVVDVNLHFCPMFEPRILEEDNERCTYVDLDGVKRAFMKAEATIPSGLEWPIKDKHSWQQLKEERLHLNNLSDRFPQNWPMLLQEYRSRDYPLAIGGYPHGFFGTLAHLIGYENLFIWYASEAKFVHEILDTFTNIWLAVFEEILAQVEIDHWQIWEDISFGKGCMISNAMVEEFLCPYIKRIADFVKSKGVNIILLDTDGDCNSIIPLFINAGVTGLFPFETHCGMDIVKVRKAYPKLQMFGGIPKSEIQKGRPRIDEILQPVEQVLQSGGYVPFGDHLIPPDVDFAHFTYYRSKLNAMIDRFGR